MIGLLGIRWLTAIVALATGCVSREVVLDTHGHASDSAIRYAGLGGHRGTWDFHNADADDTQSASVEPEEYRDLSEICGAHTHCQVVEPLVHDVDLLFVIDDADDSGAMLAAQQRLSVEFGRMLRVLHSGERGASLVPAPVESLHVGVVSSDIGLPGLGVDGCDGFGDDGVLQHTPLPRPVQVTAPCIGPYPPYLNPPAMMFADQSAQDLACVAVLGSDGCRFGQPLEASIKALWPAADPFPLPDGKNRIAFLGGAPDMPSAGHGDRENDGFLHAAHSLLALVVLTNTDDGSSADLHHLTPPEDLAPDDALGLQPPGLRNFHNPDELYPVERYVNALRALRPEDENLVVFGAIAGVPPALAAEQEGLALTTSAMDRSLFYDALREDPAMQEVPDLTSTAGDLTPSCTLRDAGAAGSAKAYPPRRLVEVARSFGSNGFVASICDNSYAPAIDMLVERVRARIGAACIDYPMQRNFLAGLVPGCDVLWQLPQHAVPGTPQRCSDLPHMLTPAGDAYAPARIDAERLCRVKQVPLYYAGLEDSDQVDIEAVEKGASGWYYEGASLQAQACTRGYNHIAFMNHNQPMSVPAGVPAILDCQ